MFAAVEDSVLLNTSLSQNRVSPQVNYGFCNKWILRYAIFRQCHMDVLSGSSHIYSFRSWPKCSYFWEIWFMRCFEPSGQPTIFCVVCQGFSRSTCAILHSLKKQAELFVSFLFWLRRNTSNQYPPVVNMASWSFFFNVHSIRKIRLNGNFTASHVTDCQRFRKKKTTKHHCFGSLPFWEESPRMICDLLRSI